MSIYEIAIQLAKLCKGGKPRQAIEELYADGATSLEPMAYDGLPRECHGKTAILAKNDWWHSIHDMHEMQVDGPFISPEYFAVIFVIDATNKQTGQRMRGREIALYTVTEGKIASDQFLGFAPDHSI